MELRPMRQGLGVLAWLLAVGAAYAATVKVRVAPSDETSGPVSAVVAAEAARGRDRQAFRLHLQAPGEISLQLEERVAWTVSVSAQGYWSPATVVVPLGGEQFVDLVLYRTGVLRGTVHWPPEGHGDGLEARFTPSPTGAPSSSATVPTGSWPCSVDDETFRCEVPAGVMDVRLWSPGYVPRYLWGVTVPAGRELACGDVTMRRGASVSGWVLSSTGVPPAVTVELLPRGVAAPAETPARGRVEGLRLRAKADRRGFFHIVGVPPGLYTLAAEARGFARTTAFPVTVRGGATSELKAPLLLKPPATLRATLWPPVDPWGRPWVVALSKQGFALTEWELITEGVAEPDGSWAARGLAPGEYELAVLSGERASLARGVGEIWVRRAVRVDRREQLTHIDLPVVEVAGKVLLGKAPLTATIWFGGRYGAVHIRAESDSKGEFTAVLPHGGSWDVDVEAESPYVRHQFPQLELAKSAGERLNVKLHVPDTVVQGRVVVEDGSPLGGAVVTVQLPPTAGTSVVTVLSDADGRFAVHGVAPGPVTLFARAQELASDPVVATVIDGREGPHVRLVARRTQTVRGVVASSWGPVVGARVSIVPLPLGAGGVFATTDPAGRFSVTLPGSTTDALLFVAPPGFARTSVRVTLPAVDGLQIPVDQLGGTLVLEYGWLRRKAATSGEGWVPVVIRDGLQESPYELLSWAAAHGEHAAAQPDAERSVIPETTMGTYSLCLVSASAYAAQPWFPQTTLCDGGFLPPGGTLVLRLPEPPSD